MDDPPDDEGKCCFNANWLRLPKFDAFLQTTAVAEM